VPTPARQAEPVAPSAPVAPPADAAGPTGPVRVAPAIPRPAGKPHSAAKLRPGRRSFSKTRLLAAAAVIVAAVGGGIAWSVASPPATPQRPQLTALQRQQAAARALAAVWVRQQVSHTTAIACDQQMCAELAADGFPKGNLNILGPKSPYPLSSALVIDTPAVRGLFGTSLSSQVAPLVVNAVGSGQAEITIRVVAPDGVAAYDHKLQADLAARKQVGTQLLQSNQITTTPTAKQQMAGGLVDTRLLFAITALASTEPVDIVGFGNVASGASSDLPLRYAELAEVDKAARTSPVTYLKSMLAALRKLPVPWLPAWTRTQKLPGGTAVLQVGFAAPSPLGLLGPNGSAGVK
jgi:hypothetical protein